jgi:hypothetical protein
MVHHCNYNHCTTHAVAAYLPQVHICDRCRTITCSFLVHVLHTVHVLLCTLHILCTRSVSFNCATCSLKSAQSVLNSNLSPGWQTPARQRVQGQQYLDPSPLCFFSSAGWLVPVPEVEAEGPPVLDCWRLRLRCPGALSTWHCAHERVSPLKRTGAVAGLLPATPAGAADAGGSRCLGG